MKIIFAALGLVLLAGCGTARVGRSDPPVNPAGVQVVSTRCTVYVYGHDARVTFWGPSASGLCAQAIRNWSTGGYFWSYAWSAPQEPPLGTLCVMSAGDGTTALVMDDGGQYIGQGVCGALAHAGWTP